MSLCHKKSVSSDTTCVLVSVKIGAGVCGGSAHGENLSFEK